MKPVAIIGGGITGLTAAFRLQQKQIPVTFYEAGSRVGGVIRSVREDGYPPNAAQTLSWRLRHESKT